MIPINNAKIVYSNLSGEAHEFNRSGDRYVIIRVYEGDDIFDDLSKICKVKTTSENAKLRSISVKVRIPREDCNHENLKDVTVKTLNASINSECLYEYDDVIKYGSAIDALLMTFKDIKADIKVKPVSYVNPRTNETGYVLYLNELDFSYNQEVHE